MDSSSQAEAHDHQQRDFFTTFFQQDELEQRRGTLPGPAVLSSGLPSSFLPSASSLPSTPSAAMNLPVDLESLLSMQAQAQSASQQGQMNPAMNTGQPPAAATTPQQMLLDQTRMMQLQILQQIQAQIFQQQMELLSGNANSSSFNGMPPLMDRSRDQQAHMPYGLPTPGASLPSSTELHAQPSTDFVSPILLQHRGMSGGGGSGAPSTPNPQQAANFLNQPLIPPTAPHSAPAHIAFGVPYSLQDTMNIDELSPISSPALGAYAQGGQTMGAMQNMSGNGIGPGTGVMTPGGSNPKKRRTTSPITDDVQGGSSASASLAPSPVTAPTRTSRRRQSNATSGAASANRLTPNMPPLNSTRKQNLRGTKSANSTPIFPSTGGMSMFQPLNQQTPQHGQQSRRNSTVSPNNDIPGDTPSPVDLSMPPPAPPASATMPPVSSQGSQNLSGDQQQQQHLTPLTPGEMMKIGRLGANTSTSTGTSGAGTTQKGKGVSTRSRAASAATAASPGLKPIRPAGNANPSTSTSGSTSQPTQAHQPVLQVRKKAHKDAEQNRRDMMKKSFDDLRILLPPIPLPTDDGYPGDGEPLPPGAMPPRGPPKGAADGPNRSVSRLQLLMCGNDFIKVLKARVERRDDEIERLRREVRRLRVIVKESGKNPDEGTGEGEGVGEGGDGGIDLERNLDEVELVGGGLFRRTTAAMQGQTLRDGDGEDD